jgi:methyl-accepting chemotaxis protein
VEQVNQVTQANAANSEEAASTAQEMSSQSMELQGLVGTFQLCQTADDTPPAPQLSYRREPATVAPWGTSAEVLDSVEEPWEEVAQAAESR